MGWLSLAGRRWARIYRRWIGLRDESTNSDSKNCRFSRGFSSTGDVWFHLPRLVYACPCFADESCFIASHSVAFFFGGIRLEGYAFKKGAESMSMLKTIVDKLFGSDKKQESTGSGHGSAKTATESAHKNSASGCCGGCGGAGKDSASADGKGKAAATTKSN